MKMQALDCPKCGAAVPPDSKFCSYCGSGLVLSDDRLRFYLVGAVCPHCQADNKESDRYCGRCGAPILRTCPACFADVPVESSHCGACGIEIEPWREELAQQIDILQGQVNSRRAVQYGMIGLAIAVVIGGFYYGGVWSMCGLSLGLLCYGFFRVLRRKNREQIEVLDVMRNSYRDSEIA